MKKRLICLLLGVISAVTVAGCGNNKVVHEMSAEVPTSVTGSEELTSSEESIGQEEKTDSKELYDRFLQNQEKVYTAQYEKWHQKITGTEWFRYEEGASFDFEEFVREAFFWGADGAEEAIIQNVYYTYLDCGADGEPELGIRIEMDMDGVMIPLESVIKNVDGKLQLTYQEVGGYRDQIDIVNQYGKVVSSGFYSYSSWTESEGYINQNGEYDVCYSSTVNLDALISLESIISGEILQNSEEDLSDLYMRSYYLGDAESADTQEYFEQLIYCGEKTEEEPSNGVDFAENMRILKSLFDAEGKTIHTMAEVEEKIADREKELCVTKEMKSNDELPDWKECDMKDSWKEAKYIYNTDETGGDMITLPYRNEVPFQESDYPELADVGSFTEAEADQLEEGIRDMNSVRLDNMNYKMNYLHCTNQCYITDEDGLTRIIETTVYDGAEEMDPVMKKVGYEGYDITFVYTSGIWKDPAEKMNKPVYAELYINDGCYQYYFSQDQCVRRYADGNATLNPKVNDFIRSLYKVGCYYGNVINKEHGNENLLITSTDRIHENDGHYEFVVQVQGDDEFHTYIVDENTRFSDDCEMEYFETYENDDTPLTWVDRVYHDQENHPMALLGILEVIRSDSYHIDYIKGIYWWD